ncbi:MAG: phosphoserine phosphatase, partial [Bradymonadia bacterium]
RGMSEDRLHVLGDEFWEETLEPSLLESGIELISRARKDGHRIVLLSENIAPVVGAMAERIRGVDDFICNSIEISGGETTGRLLPPIVGGHEGGRWLKEFAAEHDIDLSRSVAYAAGGPDLLLLAAVGEPCAVNADYTLRRAATEARWALMDYAA